MHDGETQGSPTPTFSQIFGSTLVDHGEAGRIHHGHHGGHGQRNQAGMFKEAFPKRYFDVGIAEEHGALFACGLAAEGRNPT